MDKNVKELRKILGEYEDMYKDFHFSTKDKIKKGIKLPIKMISTKITFENMIVSLFSMYPNLFRINFLQNHQNGKIAIWDTDILHLTFEDEHRQLHFIEGSIDSLSSQLQDKLNKNPQLNHPHLGLSGFLNIKLEKESVERKFEESIDFNEEEKVNEQLSILKQEMIFALSEKNHAVNIKIAHRLLLWGYQFDYENIANENNVNFIKNQCLFHSLNFKEVRELQLLNKNLLKSISNEDLLKEIELTVKKENDILEKQLSFIENLC